MSTDHKEGQMHIGWIRLWWSHTRNISSWPKQGKVVYVSDESWYDARVVLDCISQVIGLILILIPPNFVELSNQAEGRYI